MALRRDWTMSQAHIGHVHATSMRILENVGLSFLGGDAIAVFKRHGITTDGTRVYLTEDDVWGALEKAPSSFTVRARRPSHDLVIGGGRSALLPAYGAPFLTHLDAQADSFVTRRATTEDYRDLVRVVDRLPNLDSSGHMLVQAEDLPTETAYLQMLLMSMTHSTKAFVGSTQGQQGARHTMKMASILFGESLDELAESPVTLGLVNTLSPLAFSPDMTGALLEYARWAQPVVIAAAVMAGSSGPITLAGALAQQNAEVLAGIVLSQLVRPGTPVVYGGASTAVEMQTAATAFGSPEFSLLTAATAEMARHYGVPSRAGGAMTDSHVPDGQAASESMLGLTSAMTSGVDVIFHAAGFLSSTLAFGREKLVIDDDLCGMLKRIQEGMSVSDESLAYDVISDVGPGGNFLSAEHTVHRCRSEFWRPHTWNRLTLDAWQGLGGPDAARSAREQFENLLADHQDLDLDETTARQLASFVEDRM